MYFWAPAGCRRAGPPDTWGKTGKTAPCGLPIPERGCAPPYYCQAAAGRIHHRRPIIFNPNKGGLCNEWDDVGLHHVGRLYRILLLLGVERVFY
jgi:hypothetical protein